MRKRNGKGDRFMIMKYPICSDLHSRIYCLKSMGLFGSQKNKRIIICDCSSFFLSHNKNKLSELDKTYVMLNFDCIILEN